MAERNVSVRLSANTTTYIAAMKAAEAATTGLSSTGTRDLTRLGGQMQSFGRTATLGVSVPLVALGAGAVSMAAKFDTAFAQMVGLANVPASEIDNLKESVLALAGETAVAPQELAEALYFAASAGLDSAQAMEAVELAAKASAAGMGSAADVVGLVSSAIASYGAENITAAEATDILTSTIREGRAEPDELAGALGRVLPIANSLGVSFAEVGGVVAYMTNIFGDTDRAVTGVNDAFAKLAAPTDSARTILREMGTSAEELQATISSDGLLGGLQLLRDHGFAGNSAAIRELMPDMQGAATLTALLNDESGTLTSTLDSVAGSAGSLDSAFAAVSETSGFKMKQAMTDIKVAMIEIGDILLPLAATAASTIGGMVGWFTDLNPVVQKTLLVFGGLLTAMGPLTFAAGTLLKNWVQLAGAFGVSEGAASKVGKAFGVLGLVVGAAVVAWNILGEGTLNASAHIDTASTALITETKAAYDAAVAAGEATTATHALAIANVALSNAIMAAAPDELQSAYAALNISANEVLDTYVALQADAGQLASQQMILTRATGATAAEVEGYYKLVRMGINNEEILAQSLGITVDQYRVVSAALYEVSGAAIENQDEIDALALTHLEAQVQLGGTAEAALLAAEEIAGSRYEAGNAVPVYQEFVRQLTLLDPAAAQAIVGLDTLGTSTSGTTTAVDDLNSALPRSEQLLEEAYDASSKAADGYRLLVTESKAVVSHLDDMSDAASLAGMAFDTTADTVQGVIDGIAEAGDKSGDTAVKFADLGGAADEAAGGFGALEDAVDDLMSAFEAIMNPADDLRSAARDVNSTIAAVAENMIDVADASVDMSAGFDVTTEAGRTAEETYIAARDAIYAHGLEMMRNGASAEEAAGDIDFNTGSLEANMLAAGYTEEQIADLNAEYFLTPEEVRTQLETIGAAQAAAEIAHHKETLGTIPGKQTTTIDVLTNPTDVTNVKGQLDSIVNQIRTAYIGVTGPGTKAVTGVIGRAALGTYVATDGLWQLHGNEAVFPLDNPGRMRQLTDDPRIGGPLLAALAGHMTPAPAMSGWGGPPPAASSPSTSLSFGDIHVGDRRDAAPFVNALEEVLFVAKYAS